MARIIPFRGILYNKEKVGNLTSVVAPPYDVISPKAREMLYEKTPYNIVRIDFGKEHPGDNEQENCYTRAARLWKEWLRDGILIRDEQPAIYLCRETYTVDGEKRMRTGFIAAVRLENFDSGAIRPHEKTLSGPKVDRLNLLRATKVNFNPIFGLYSDPSLHIERLLSETNAAQPVSDVRDEQGNRHALLRITDEDLIEAVTQKMAQQTLIIADGHHRYETALHFRNEQEAHRTNHHSPISTHQSPLTNHQYVMMYLTNLEHPGLTVLPTHRLLHKLPDFDEAVLRSHLKQFFEIRPVPTVRELLDRMAKVERESEQNTFGLYLGHGDFLLLTLTDRAGAVALMAENTSSAWQTLDVAIIHAILIRHLLKMRPEVLRKGSYISYAKDALQAVEMVDRGEHQLALFLNPTKVTQVKAIAESGEVMPQKSTYFYPKLLTGLVMREAL
ncbi:MAG: DUF1015 domain-containing protein [Candidatus Latescibacteria bacterium]|nr:DUF1015 domain-containing protein [Candidatus Latescibacterota bacterium]